MENEWNEMDFNKISYKTAIKTLRQNLKDSEYNNWSNLNFHGRGVKIFKECESINKTLFFKDELTCSECISYLKIIPNVSSCRALPGRSQDGISCRRCSENYETLPHI